MATPHPAPVHPFPRKARTQITLVLPPLFDPARVSWLINFKLREVKPCARGVRVAHSPGPAPIPIQSNAGKVPAGSSAALGLLRMFLLAAAAPGSC